LLFASYPTGLLQSYKYDTALFAYSTGVDPSDNLANWHSHQVPPEGQNTTHFINAEMDRVLDEGNRTLARKDRQPLYWKMTDILNANLPVIPLVFWTEMHGVNRHLMNFRANPSSSRFVWNVQDWYIDDASPSAGGKAENPS